MSDPDPQFIIRTKLSPPPFRPFHIRRSGIVRNFPDPSTAPVVLVTAPAGFGKSTLVSEYLEEADYPSAWFSIDEHDDDIRFFLKYLSGAVESAYPDSCRTLVEILDSPVLPSIRHIIATLVDLLEELGGPLVLVLDDYHFIRTRHIHEFMIDFIIHQPKNVSIVVISRKDPPFPLHTWRASGKLTDIRQSDLAFSRTDINDIVYQRISRNPSDDELNFLETASEGWGVGLHLLLSVSSSDSEDIRFDHGQTRPLRNIREFFLKEVLHKEPDDLQQVLLRLSILDRFNEALYEAFVDDTDCDVNVFDSLVSNDSFFVVSLDSGNEWYRFHHQLQSILRAELGKSVSDDELSSLYQTASLWYESQGYFNEALRYAVESGNQISAAEFVERNYEYMLNNDSKGVVHSWLNRLPADLVWSRPGLLIAKIFISEFLYLLDELPAMIDSVETLLQGRDDIRDFSGEIAHFKGLVSFWKGDQEQSRQYFETALENLNTDQFLLVGESQMYISLNRCISGEKDAVIDELDTAVHALTPENPLLATRLIAARIYIHLFSGDLFRVIEGTSHLQAIAGKHNLRHTGSWSSYLIASARFHMWEPEKALESFHEAMLGSSSMYFRAFIDILCGTVLALQFLGRENEADKNLDVLNDLAFESENPRLQSVAQSCRARVLLHRGDWNQANEIQRTINLSAAPPDTFFWIESPMISAVRILVSLSSPETLENAHGYLRKLQETVRQNGFKCRIVDLLVLESLVLDKQGSKDKADHVFLKALQQGVEGKWLRPFVEPGKDVIPLLQRVNRKDIDNEYYIEIQKALQAGNKHRLKPRLPEETLEESLTNRELDVLEMVARRMQDKEIADELSISPQTVRTHIKHLFAKLDVSGRRNLVSRAKELGLIADYPGYESVHS